MSVVTNHFPQIKFQQADKYLWNPIQKKSLKNQPEERVRLRVVEYLLEAGWSKYRISTEEGISSLRKETLRTDLICYTDKFEPFLLCECKAPSVNLSDQTAEQIARYNSNVKAPYLFMTNGRNDLWYSFKEKGPVLQSAIPEPFQAANQPEERLFEYWTKRGFAGKKAALKLRRWLLKTFNVSVCQSTYSLHYLSFKSKLSDIDLNHYYLIFEFSESRLALTFIATAFGGSRMVAIENKNGENTAVLEINLDLLFKEETPNASVYNAGGSKNIDIRKKLDWDEVRFNLHSFSEKVKKLLDE